MRALSYNNNQINIIEPFEGLLHKEWFATKLIKILTIMGKSDEIETIDGKKFLKSDNSKQIKVGPSESMSKSKNTVDPEFIISNYGADAADYLFYR